MRGMQLLPLFFLPTNQTSSSVNEQSKQVAHVAFGATDGF